MAKFNLLSKKPNFKEFPFHASVSKIKTFDVKSGGCHQKYRFGYIEKLPKKEWDFHFFGKYSHRVLELFERTMMQNIEKAKDPDFCVLTMLQQKEIALQEFGSKLTEAQINEAFNIFDIYLGQYCEAQEKNLAPQVLAVEDEFYIDLDGKLLLQGVIDRREIDSDGVRKCTDYKTSKEMNFLEKDDFQLLTYCLVEFLRHPEEKIFRGSYVMLKHQCQAINFQYTPEEVWVAGEKFLNYAEEIQKEKLFRPNPTALCYYCDYNDVSLCPEGARMTQIIEKKKQEKELREKLKDKKSIIGASSWST